MKEHCFVPSPECHSNNASYVLVSVSDSHRTSASRISGWHLLRQNALCACGVVLVPRKLQVSCYRGRQPGAISRYSTGEQPHSINLLPFKSTVHLGEFRKIAFAHGPCSGKHLWYKPRVGPRSSIAKMSLCPESFAILRMVIFVFLCLYS